MGIRHGEQWGSRELPPAGLRSASTDEGIAELLSSGCSDVAIRGGDMFRTLGGGSDGIEGADSTMTRLPIDVLQVRYQSPDDGRTTTEPAISHVVMRSSNLRGGWLTGPVLIVANAQFLGPWDVAPRGHPNDGRCEVLEVAADMSKRQRISARRRALNGSHVPHPSIRIRSTKSYRYDGPELMMWIDGKRRGLSGCVDIEVVSDGAVMWL